MRVVLSQLIVPVAMVVELALGGPASGASASRAIAAQSTTSSAAEGVTDRRARAASAARQAQVRLSARKRALLIEYRRHTQAIEKLSRQRASWNRDRKIRALKKDAQSTAGKLAAIDRQLAAAKRRLKARRTELLAAVESELRGGATGARARQLRSLQRALARELRPAARKIIVPDGELDPLADPEELEEQMRLIARAERQLRAEEKKLARLEAHYRHQEELRRQRDRAREMERLEAEGVRRGTGIGAAADRSSNEAGDSASPGGAGEFDEEPGDPPPDGDPGGGTADLNLETSSVVLADVIDDVTAADLRRASRSTNPRLRAQAADKAQREVEKKLRQLRAQRLRIERRVRSLRR